MAVLPKTDSSCERPLNTAKVTPVKAYIQTNLLITVHFIFMMKNIELKEQNFIIQFLSQLERYYSTITSNEDKDVGKKTQSSPIWSNLW